MQDNRRFYKPVMPHKQINGVQSVHHQFMPELIRQQSQLGYYNRQGIFVQLNSYMINVKDDREIWMKDSEQIRKEKEYQQLLAKHRKMKMKEKTMHNREWRNTMGWFSGTIKPYDNRLKATLNKINRLENPPSQQHDQSQEFYKQEDEQEHQQEHQQQQHQCQEKQTKQYVKYQSQQNSNDNENNNHENNNDNDNDNNDNDENNNDIDVDVDMDNISEVQSHEQDIVIQDLEKCDEQTDQQETKNEKIVVKKTEKEEKNSNDESFEEVTTQDSRVFLSNTANIMNDILRNSIMKQPNK